MQANDISAIRNFCIIAHIDHGKSTLADRLMLLTNTVAEREFQDQLLDGMDLERERGITIKSQPVTMRYNAADGREYVLNLIDTPGHVDFAYEVSRSMAACDGALLVVDAAQGVEAQTLATVYLAMQNDLEIIPVINKVDLPSADVDATCKQIEDLLALSTEDRLFVSAKTGDGVAAVLETIVNKIPAPLRGADNAPVRALVFDSIYDEYRGVVSYLRVIDGELRAGDEIVLMGNKRQTLVKELGIFRPQATPVERLAAGDVGYLISTIKTPSEIRIGDTVTKTREAATEPLPGFATIRPVVFSGIYPVNAADYEKLKASMDKLTLNDSAISYQAESSIALGFGFRCGFLGLLHLEIVQERLRREYGLSIISTYPGVVYKVYLNNGEVEEIDNPINFPDPTRVDHFEEPILKVFIICLSEQIGDIMKLVMDRRGVVDETTSIDASRVMLTCTMPLNEILIDFHDALKSASRGYASMDYEHKEYRPGDLVKLDILLNGEAVDAFACIVHRTKAAARGRQMCNALKEVIPPHLFAIPVQAAVNSKIVARETIRALRKDVTAKCYGGDITRKRKLLDRQKEGKKRMKQVGKVNVPQEAFISVLKS